ncbi:MAG TPA: ATP-binding protein [Ktedonobacteraceae bacterium]|nr:ATP-binding protein [Ktedonobacteraceae bacterium]
MDKLENEHKPEEISYFASDPQKQAPEIGHQGNAQSDRDSQQWLEKRWQRLADRLRDSTFTPEWLPAPWNHPVLSYIFAFLVPFGSIILALLLKQIFLTFVFPGVLIIMAILVVALLWGTGPGLLATLWGTILFNILVLSPRYALSLSTFQDVFETCFLLVIGIIISLVVSRIEHVRAEAVAAHLRIEKLVTQLEAEKESLHQARQLALDRAGEIEAIFEAMADGVYVYDSQGHLLRTNTAAQTINPLLKQSDYQARSFPERLSSVIVLDEHRQQIDMANVPLTRVLRGEMITGERSSDTILLKQNGTDILMNMSGAPIRDDEGRVRGAVIVSRDITRRRNLEMRTREALDALLAMAQLIGKSFGKTGSAGDNHQEKTGFTSQEIAGRIAELTRRFLGCQRLSISIIEPGTEIIRPLAVVGLSQEQEQKWWKEQQQQESRLVDNPDQSIVQRLRANEVVLFDMTQPPWNSYPNPYAIRTMLIAPMSSRDRLVGLLTLDYGGVEHLYTSEELELAGAAANLAGTIIERDLLLRQQTELLASNQQMAELISLAHDAIVVRTPASSISFWNKGAERLYGWTEQEASGQVSHELLQTRFPHSREVTDNLIMLHGQWEGQITHTRRDGAQVNVESRQVLLQDESGQPAAILEINRDITERERMQHEREEALASELALREANRRMDEFIGIISHELRTPLTTIKGNVQLARLRLRTSLTEVPVNKNVLRNMLEEIQLMLERAERQANVQNRMVSDLLDISRLQADKLELRLVLCDLVTIVHEMIEDQRSTTLKHVIKLEKSEGETAPIIADPERIGQVLSNYLTNALKYSQEGRPVVVELKKERNMVRVLVKDEGVGLTRSEQEQIWERFYQVKTIKRLRGSSVGLGLGLYICRAIIEEHQGEVGVESTKGVGSTFWFTLPLAVPYDQRVE